MTIGALIIAIGALGVGLAGLVFVLGARRPLPRRERDLTAGASAAVAAALCIAAGETLVAIGFATHGAPTWEPTALFLALAARLLYAVAFAALAPARSHGRAA